MWVLNSSAFQANCRLLGHFLARVQLLQLWFHQFFCQWDKGEEVSCIEKGTRLLFSEIILHYKSRPHLQGFSSCHSETLSPLSPLSSRQPSPLKLFSVLGKLEDISNRREKSSSLLSPPLFFLPLLLALSLIPSPPQCLNRPSPRSVCLCVLSLSCVCVCIHTHKPRIHPEFNINAMLAGKEPVNLIETS